MKLEKAGIDATEVRESAQRAVAQISQDLTTLVAREPVVKLNGEEYSIMPAVQERLLQSRQRPLLENGAGDGGGAGASDGTGSG